MLHMRVLVAAFLVLHLTNVVSAINNGVGLTPAMGYNTWNDFRCSGITADHVKQVADKFDELKLKSFGYEYVNIDDCWCTARDSQGHLVPDPSAFPDGMTAVGDYIHSKGLKFGIYTDRGTKTCDGRPAAQGYEAQDAHTFASWGVDYLKVTHPLGVSACGLSMSLHSSSVFFFYSKYNMTAGGQLQR